MGNTAIKENKILLSKVIRKDCVSFLYLTWRLEQQPLSATAN